MLTNSPALASTQSASLSVIIGFHCSARVKLYTDFIQLGYWIVEALVDRTTEFYPRGGLAQLARRCLLSSPRKPLIFILIRILTATRLAAARQSRHSRHPRPPRTSWRAGSGPTVYWQVRSIYIIIRDIIQGDVHAGVPRMFNSTYVSFACV